MVLPKWGKVLKVREMFKRSGVLQASSKTFLKHKEWYIHAHEIWCIYRHFLSSRTMGDMLRQS